MHWIRHAGQCPSVAASWLNSCRPWRYRCRHYGSAPSPSLLSPFHSVMLAVAHAVFGNTVLGVTALDGGKGYRTIQCIIDCIFLSTVRLNGYPLADGIPCRFLHPETHSAFNRPAAKQSCIARCKAKGCSL